MKAKNKIIKQTVWKARDDMNPETLYGLATEVNAACDEFFRRRGIDPEPRLWGYHGPQLDWGMEESED